MGKGEKEGAEKAAFASGVEISQFFALFNYFLNETPEGRAAKKEMNEAWLTTVAELRDEKQLRGSDFSCGEWLRQVQKELLAPKKVVEKGKVENRKIASGEKKEVGAKKVPVKKKGLRFRNV